jgi:hypothetical protein
MSRNDLPLDELLRLALAAAADDVHTAVPATVVKYDAAKKRADVRVGVRRQVTADDGGDAYEALPVIPNVPVGWPGAGGFFFHLPLVAGDAGWLFFSEADAQRWYATGEVSDPRDPRRHTLTSPLFMPIPRAPGSRTGAYLATDGVFSIGSELAKFVALAEATEARLQALETFAAGHAHTSAAPGSPTSPAAPPFVPVATPVASSNLKADA